METDEMVVKSVSVPVGLEELMEGLTKEVIRKKPKNICMFASEHFEHLLSLREQGCYKSHKLKQVKVATKKASTQKLQTDQENLYLKGSNKFVTVKVEKTNNGQNKQTQRKEIKKKIDSKKIPTYTAEDSNKDGKMFVKASKIIPKQENLEKTNQKKTKLNIKKSKDTKPVSINLKQNKTDESESIKKMEETKPEIPRNVSDRLEKSKSLVESSLQSRPKLEPRNSSDNILETVKNISKPIASIRPLQKESETNLSKEREDCSSSTENSAETIQTAKFDSDKLKEEVKSVQAEAELTNYKNNFNPYLLRREIREASVFSDEAARKIQALWKGYLVRKKFIAGLFSVGKREVKAAIVVQAFWRGYCVRKSIKKLREKNGNFEIENSKNIDAVNAVLILQRFWRGIKGKRKDVPETLMDSEESNRNEETSEGEFAKAVRAAKIIQNFWRNKPSQKDYHSKTLSEGELKTEYKRLEIKEDSDFQENVTGKEDLNMEPKISEINQKNKIEALEVDSEKLDKIITNDEKELNVITEIPEMKFGSKPENTENTVNASESSSDVLESETVSGNDISRESLKNVENFGILEAKLEKQESTKFEHKDIDNSNPVDSENYLNATENEANINVLRENKSEENIKETIQESLARNENTEILETILVKEVVASTAVEDTNNESEELKDIDKSKPENNENNFSSSENNKDVTADEANINAVSENKIREDLKVRNQETLLQSESLKSAEIPETKYTEQGLTSELKNKEFEELKDKSQHESSENNFSSSVNIEDITESEANIDAISENKIGEYLKVTNQETVLQSAEIPETKSAKQESTSEEAESKNKDFKDKSHPESIENNFSSSVNNKDITAGEAIINAVSENKIGEDFTVTSQETVVQSESLKSSEIYEIPETKSVEVQKKELKDKSQPESPENYLRSSESSKDVTDSETKSDAVSENKIEEDLKERNNKTEFNSETLESLEKAEIPETKIDDKNKEHKQFNDIEKSQSESPENYFHASESVKDVTESGANSDAVSENKIGDGLRATSQQRTSQREVLSNKESAEISESDKEDVFAKTEDTSKELEKIKDMDNFKPETIEDNSNASESSKDVIESETNSKAITGNKIGEDLKESSNETAFNSETLESPENAEIPETKIDDKNKEHKQFNDVEKSQPESPENYFHASESVKDVTESGANSDAVSENKIGDGLKATSQVSTSQRKVLRNIESAEISESDKEDVVFAETEDKNKELEEIKDMDNLKPESIEDILNASQNSKDVIESETNSQAVTGNKIGEDLKEKNNETAFDSEILESPENAEIPETKLDDKNKPECTENYFHASESVKDVTESGANSDAVSENKIGDGLKATSQVTTSQRKVLQNIESTEISEEDAYAKTEDKNKELKEIKDIENSKPGCIEDNFNASESSKDVTESESNSEAVSENKIGEDLRESIFQNEVLRNAEIESENSAKIKEFTQIEDIDKSQSDNTEDSGKGLGTNISGINNQLTENEVSIYKDYKNKSEEEEEISKLINSENKSLVSAEIPETKLAKRDATIEMVQDETNDLSNKNEEIKKSEFKSTEEAIENPKMEDTKSVSSENYLHAPEMKADITETETATNVVLENKIEDNLKQENNSQIEILESTENEEPEDQRSDVTTNSNEEIKNDVLKVPSRTELTNFSDQKQNHKFSASTSDEHKSSNKESDSEANLNKINTSTDNGSRRSSAETHTNMKNIISAAIKIQTFWRGILARNHKKNDLEKEKSVQRAAVIIQSIWRGYRTKKRFLEMLGRKESTRTENRADNRSEDSQTGANEVNGNVDGKEEILINSERKQMTERQLKRDQHELHKLNIVDTKKFEKRSVNEEIEVTSRKLEGMVGQEGNETEALKKEEKDEINSIEENLEKCDSNENEETEISQQIIVTKKQLSNIQESTDSIVSNKIDIIATDEDNESNASDAMKINGALLLSEKINKANTLNDSDGNEIDVTNVSILDNHEDDVNINSTKEEDNKPEIAPYAKIAISNQDIMDFLAQERQNVDKIFKTKESEETQSKLRSENRRKLETTTNQNFETDPTKVSNSEDKNQSNLKSETNILGSRQKTFIRESSSLTPQTAKTEAVPDVEKLNNVRENDDENKHKIKTEKVIIDLKNESLENDSIIVDKSEETNLQITTSTEENDVNNITNLLKNITKLNSELESCAENSQSANDVSEVNDNTSEDKNCVDVADVQEEAEKFVDNSQTKAEIATKELKNKNEDKIENTVKFKKEEETETHKQSTDQNSKELKNEDIENQFDGNDFSHKLSGKKKNSIGDEAELKHTKTILKQKSFENHEDINLENIAKDKEDTKYLLEDNLDINEDEKLLEIIASAPEIPEDTTNEASRAPEKIPERRREQQLIRSVTVDEPKVTKTHFPHLTKAFSSSDVQDFQDALNKDEGNVTPDCVYKYQRLFDGNESEDEIAKSEKSENEINSSEKLMSKLEREVKECVSDLMDESNFGKNNLVNSNVHSFDKNKENDINLTYNSKYDVPLQSPTFDIKRLHSEIEEVSREIRKEGTIEETPDEALESYDEVDGQKSKEENPKNETLEEIERSKDSELNNSEKEETDIEIEMKVRTDRMLQKSGKEIMNVNNFLSNSKPKILAIQNESENLDTVTVVENKSVEKSEAQENTLKESNQKFPNDLIDNKFSSINQKSKEVNDTKINIKEVDETSPEIKLADIIEDTKKPTDENFSNEDNDKIKIENSQEAITEAISEPVTKKASNENENVNHSKFEAQIIEEAKSEIVEESTANHNKSLNEAQKPSTIEPNGTFEASGSFPKSSEETDHIEYDQRIDSSTSNESIVTVIRRSEDSAENEDKKLHNAAKILHRAFKSLVAFKKAQRKKSLNKPEKSEKVDVETLTSFPHHSSGLTTAIYENSESVEVQLDEPAGQVFVIIQVLRS